MPVIGTNVSANTALTSLNRNSNSQSESLSKLSSGSRIVIASDDAAGLAVASRLRSDISTFDQAQRNAIQARAVLEVADGALSEITDMLQRMKSLGAQALSGAVTLTERQFMAQEFQQIQAEVTATANATTFNGQILLSGTYSENFLVGPDADTLAPGGGDYIQADLLALNARADGLGVDGAIGISVVTNVPAALTAIDGGIDLLAQYRSTVGSLISRFEYRESFITTAIENLDAAQSAIMDVDIAAEQTALVSNQVLTETSLAALSQAHQMEQSLLSIVR